MPVRVHATHAAVRTHSHAAIHAEAGKGVPDHVSKTLKEPSKHMLTVGNRVTVIPYSVVSQISAKLDLEQFEFPSDGGITSETDVLDPLKSEGSLDVTALDRYNEDIRRLRRLTIEECRLLPVKGNIDEQILIKVRLTIRSLCRTAYYGTHKAQVLAEGMVVLITWLLNLKNVPVLDKIHFLQSFAEMMWTSEELKTALVKCHGIRVLAKLMSVGLLSKPELARWACYVVTICCVSSVELILAVKKIAKFHEVVGEMAFYQYWMNWPVNFGSILQGILYGPHSVIPIEDDYDFI